MMDCQIDGPKGLTVWKVPRKRIWHLHRPYSLRIVNRLIVTALLLVLSKEEPTKPLHNPTPSEAIRGNGRKGYCIAHTKTAKRMPNEQSKMAHCEAEV